MCRGEAAWDEGGLRNVVADSPAIDIDALDVM